MSEIGKNLLIPKPHVTVLVDKLIEEKYVERHDDPNDRRRINIGLTEKGLKNFEKIKQTVSASLKEKLLSLNDKQLQQLAVCSQNLRETMSHILTDKQ